MKKMIAIIVTVCVLLLFGGYAYAQSHTYKREGNKFVKENVKPEVSEKTPDVLTKYTYEVKVKGEPHEFPVYITKNNACYIVRTSNRGKQYKEYLPKELAATIAQEMGRKVKEAK